MNWVVSEPLPRMLSAIGPPPTPVVADAGTTPEAARVPATPAIHKRTRCLAFIDSPSRASCVIACLHLDPLGPSQQNVPHRPVGTWRGCGPLRNEDCTFGYGRRNKTGRFLHLAATAPSFSAAVTRP